MPQDSGNIYQLNQQGIVEDVTPVSETTAPAKDVTPSVPISQKAAALVAKVPNWVWLVGGTIAFLGVVYVLHKQYKRSTRRTNASRSRARPYAKARKQRLITEADSE